MLKEGAKADVTLTSNINSRVPETVTKIIEQSKKKLRICSILVKGIYAIFIG
jgi:hypothetical protein